MARPQGESEGETLMGTMVPVPSDSTSYISIPVAEQLDSTSNGYPNPNPNPRTAFPILPVQSNLTPYFAIADQSNTSLAADDGPSVLGVPPFSLASKQIPRPGGRCCNLGNFGNVRNLGKFHRILVLVALLLLLLLAVLVPVGVVVRSRRASRDEARRVFEIRAYKHRTGFHFQPDKNWMNDPNGPMYYRGYYHLFYQYNPDGAIWGNIVWGHAVSTDLINWRHLEPALRGDQWYDIRGVWSGSATILPDGAPVLMYTGWSNASQQIQCTAVPANQSDPLLRQWVKAPQNPIAEAPPGYSSSEFRDPSTSWRGPDATFRLLVGASAAPSGTTGTALLFKSTDFQTWTFNASLHSVPNTGMWECPDFYPVARNGSALGSGTSSYGAGFKHVLKISSNDKRSDYYAVGAYDVGSESFAAESVGLDAGVGLRYDYGKFYASKSFFEEGRGRRVLFGWVNESDSGAANEAKGWASVMSLPRQVWLDNRTTTDLIQYPVEELKSLRGAETSVMNLAVGAASSVKLDGVAGNQLDIEISFQIAFPDQVLLQPPELIAESGQQFCTQAGSPQGNSTILRGPFGVYVLATDDFREQTAVYFRVLQSPGEGVTILVCSDQSRSSVAPNLDTAAFGSFVRIYENDQFLTLRILVDHSIVETFVQGGRTVITSRVYPELALDNAAHVFLFNNGTEPVTASSVRVWNMNPVHITQFS